MNMPPRRVLHSDGRLRMSHIFASQTEKRAAVKHHLNEQTSHTAITLEDQLLGGVVVGEPCSARAPSYPER